MISLGNVLKITSYFVNGIRLWGLEAKNATFIFNFNVFKDIKTKF